MIGKNRVFQQWSVVVFSVITLFSSSSIAKYSGGSFTLKDCELNCENVFNFALIL